MEDKMDEVGLKKLVIRYKKKFREVRKKTS